MRKHGCLLMLLALGVVSCGGEPPPQRTPTVFDPLVEKKEAIPAAVQAAQARHDADARQQIETAEGGPPAEERR